MESFPGLARQLICVGRLSSDDVATSTVRRAFGRGELTKLRRGVYTRAEAIPGSLPGDERAEARRHAFLQHILGVGVTRRGSVVFSHDAAAAIWDLPLVSGWPRYIDLLVAPDSARRSKNGVVVHHRAFDARDICPWTEFWVTTPARTIVDLARDGRHTDAVVALDYMLSPERAPRELRLEKTDVLASAARWPSRGDRRLEHAVEFASPLSGSPRESLSRVLIDELGFPAPQLQVTHHAPGGSHFATDFEWPERKLVGEYDGEGKYLKPEYLRGRTPGQAVVDEKWREDILRAEGNAVVRWGKHETRDPWALRRLLLSKGLPIVRRPRWAQGSRV